MMGFGESNRVLAASRGATPGVRPVGMETPVTRRAPTADPGPVLTPNSRLETDPVVTTPLVTVRYFGPARDAAGASADTLRGATVESVLAEAVASHGGTLSRVVASSRVWVNQQPAESTTQLRAGDEVAVLPPVSGGAC